MSSLENLLNSIYSLRSHTVSYPRVFKLIRDRSDTPKARLGHVADGVEWTAGGAVTLRWKGPQVGFSQLDTMGAMKAVFGDRDPLTGMYDTRVVYVEKAPQLDRRLTEAVDHLYYVLGDYIDRTQKQAHVAREDLQKAFGAVQDLIIEGTPKSVRFPRFEANTTDACA